MGDYVCIECGERVHMLYKQYDGGFVKLLHCPSCHALLDKYVEYDWVLIALDALLHRTQAYRHIIYNSHIQSHARLTTLFVAFDAYSKWTQMKDHAEGEADDIFIFYAAMEISFYKMVLLSMLEMAASFLALFVALSVIRSDRPFKFMAKSVILSSMGKVLVAPAVIWARNDAAVYLALIRLLQFTSNTQALSVMTRLKIWQAAILSGLMVGAESGCRILAPRAISP